MRYDFLNNSSKHNILCIYFLQGFDSDSIKKGTSDRELMIPLSSTFSLSAGSLDLLNYSSQ